MVKRKAIICKTIHRKLKIAQHQPSKNRRWTSVLRI